MLVLLIGESVGDAMAINTLADVSPPEQHGQCPHCLGTGWRHNSNEDKRVMRCECKLGSRAKKLIENAGIPPRYESCTLETYRAESSKPSLVNAKAKALKFVEQYPIDKTGLIFVGKAGAGKTHLAIGIIKELTSRKGITCLFCNFQELLEKIKNSYDPSVQTTSMGLLRPVFDSEVIVLDDLGSVIPTGWVWDTVSLILNTRYNANLTTIITTNFQDGTAASSDEDGEAARARRANREQTLGDRIGERMRDRVHEMCRMISIWDVPSYRDRNPN